MTRPLSLFCRHPRWAPALSSGRAASASASALTLSQRLGTVFGSAFASPYRRFGNAARVSAGASSVRIASPTAKRVDLPNIWLRDNCRCAQCVNQDTAQRNVETFQIPRDIRATTTTPDDEGLYVAWSDGHASHYPWSLLDHYQTHDHRVPDDVDRVLWGASIASRPPTVHYDAVMDTTSDAGIAQLTDCLAHFGLVFVDGTPADTPEPTQQLLERIAFVRVTHYGGFYDFVPDLAMADTAYTNLPLPAHTDNTYFTDPSGLQAFHLLSHRAPDGSDDTNEPLGGASLFVDAFYAAQILQAEDPAAYDVLARVRLPWHASGNAGITIAPDRRYPVLELLDDRDGESPSGGRLHRVRWNNDDRGVVPFDDGDPTAWYDAARAWDAILRRPDVEYAVQLVPGRAVIFDNWRVMHGRRRFVGQRRMCGGYINRDDWVSRWRNTNRPRARVLEQVVG